MSMTLRRLLLWVTAAIGAYVGLWASFWPASFYDSFPGLGRIWIAVDGPFNEHLIRDVGGLYLGLAVASAAATFSRSPDAGRVIGVAWVVFGLPHLIYHASQFRPDAPGRRDRERHHPRWQPDPRDRAAAAGTAGPGPIRWQAAEEGARR